MVMRVLYKAWILMNLVEKKMRISEVELKEERDAVKHLL
jgi:hypothetical protein